MLFLLFRKICVIVWKKYFFGLRGANNFAANRSNQRGPAHWQKRFGTEEACLEELIRVCRPDGDLNVGHFYTI